MPSFQGVMIISYGLGRLDHSHFISSQILMKKWIFEKQEPLNLLQLAFTWWTDAWHSDPTKTNTAPYYECYASLETLFGCAWLLCHVEPASVEPFLSVFLAMHPSWKISLLSLRMASGLLAHHCQTLLYLFQEKYYRFAGNSEIYSQSLKASVSQSLPLTYYRFFTDECRNRILLKWHWPNNRSLHLSE